MSDALLSLEDAANALGYSASGLRKIIRKRGIQFFQVGKGPIKFRREWIDDFIDTNSVVPKKPRPRTEPQHLKRPA